MSDSTSEISTTIGAACLSGITEWLHVPKKRRHQGAIRSKVRATTCKRGAHTIHYLVAVASVARREPCGIVLQFLWQAVGAYFGKAAVVISDQKGPPTLATAMLNLLAAEVTNGRANQGADWAAGCAAEQDAGATAEGLSDAIFFGATDNFRSIS